MTISTSPLKGLSLIPFTALIFVSCKKNDDNNNLRASIDASIITGESTYSGIFVDANAQSTVGFTEANNAYKIFQAIKAGAFGYLLKDESSEKLCEMLLQMQENGVGPVSPGIAHKILQLVQNGDISFNKKQPVDEPNLFELTAREKEILELLVQGLLYKEISARLGISPHTAKKHVLNIYGKLHVNSRSQAAHLAYGKGYIKAPNRF